MKNQYEVFGIYELEDGSELALSDNASEEEMSELGLWDIMNDAPFPPKRFEIRFHDGDVVSFDDIDGVESCLKSVGRA